MAVESEKPEIDYVRYLRNNLLDSYKYGDGYTVFKELIQNASDAEADTLKVYVIDTLKNAKCSEALRTPAIVVYDNGKFDETNKKGILKIASDNKTSESSKIGRYGLGMKSIFHICDFFIYAANTKDFPYKQVFPVNYWPSKDTRFSSFSDDDINLVLDNLPKEVDIRRKEGFILYIPIKITKENSWENVSSQTIDPNIPFGSYELLAKRIQISLALLSEVAPQEKKLQSITYNQSDTFIEVTLENKHKIKYIKTKSNKGKSETLFITYKPEVPKVVLEKISGLKNSNYWTSEQKENLKPEICFELLREEKDNKDSKGLLKIDFCVYLPLEEEYCSKSYEIDSKYNYTILIHSNFAVDSGRRGIRGFGDLLDEATEAGIDSEEGILKLWNKYLAQMVLFPNIPLLLNEAKELIKEHNDYCEIINKLYSTCFVYTGKNIPLCNQFTTQKYGFANIYEEGWSSFELTKDKSNFIFLPYSKEEKEIQTLFPIIKEKKSKFVLKTPDQNFILPDFYKPDEQCLAEVIKNVPAIGLLEEKYIVAFKQFIDYQKDIISTSPDLQKVLIQRTKVLLSDLSFDDLSKNQTRLSELFKTINEVTADSPYKVYSIGQKDKSDLLKLYTIEDFKTFWNKEIPFVFVPGFIRIENDSLPKLRENVFEGNNTVCDFINKEENCRVQLHYDIVSSVLSNKFNDCLKLIAEKYPVLKIFEVWESYKTDEITFKSKKIDYKLIQDLVEEKKLFKTPINPSAKDTLFKYYAATIFPINIYHVNTKIREAAGFPDNEIPSADDARSIFDSFSKLYYDSRKKTYDDNYEINLDLSNECWEKLLDEGFKETDDFKEKFEINEDNKQFYRFLFSRFDKELRDEPLSSFNNDVPDVWKEVYKNIAPDARKIPISIPARAKEQIKKNEKLLNINYLDTNGCKEKLRNYALNNSLEFFKTEYFQNKKNQKQLFSCLTSSEVELYKAIPLHINAKTGELIDATGTAYLNPDEIEFPQDCDLKIKLIQISDDPEISDIQGRFLKPLTIKNAVIEALSSKKQDADISQWVFNNIKASGTTWKNIFEQEDEHRYFHWIPLKTGKNKTFCDVQEILNDKIFTSDTRKWISEHYEMFNVSDLNISSSGIELLKTKKLLAETDKEQLDYIGRKVDKSISFKLNYNDSKSFFADFYILKDFIDEPIFGLVNVLKLEKKEKSQEVFDFYNQRRILGNEKSKKILYERLINYICDKQEVNQQTLNLYETILKYLLIEENFDITLIKYPTQKNEWKSPDCISSSNSSNISKKYLMNDRIHNILNDYNLIKEDKYEFKENNSDEIKLTDESDCESIKQKFAIWENCLYKKKLLYLFFYLLKGNFQKLAFALDNPNKLNEKDLLPLIEDLRYIPLNRNKKFIFSSSEPYQRIEWWNSGYSKEQAIGINPSNEQFKVIIHIPIGKKTKVHSLTGSLISIDMVDGNDISIEGPACKYPNIFHISLIDTMQKVTNLDEKLEKLIWFVWKEIYQQENEFEFNKMIQNFKESNQNTIKTVQFFMFENLISHLKDLNLNHPFFKEIFKNYQNLLYEKARRDNSKEQFLEHTKRKDALSQKLIDYITSDDYEADFFIEDIFNCVVKKIDQAKYDQSRILFELLQNADDAVSDLVENGKSITGRTKFEVIDSVSRTTKYPAIHVSHFGRLINESFNFNKETEDRYSNDLLNMLLINSSEKDESSTGKFGLGFKSVYFVCQEPIIRSGDLQFKILGALYPKNEQSELLRANETRIELTLNKKADPDIIYGDFEKNADLQVLFCKYIDEINIRGTQYKPELQTGEKNGIGLYYSENKKYLRFGFDSGILIFKVSPDLSRVESFGESSISRVWNLTPLATAKTLPFAINSSFEVDIGRKNLDEQNDRNEHLLTILSDDFSEALCHIIERKDKDFYKYVPSILNLILNGCRIQDSNILAKFCKDVLQAIFVQEKIIPDGIGGIVNNPSTPYYIAPNRFNLEYDTKYFNELLIRLQAVINDEKVVTRNVADALSASSLEFNEIDGPERILRLISGGTKIINKNAEEFITFVNLLPYGLPTSFNWDMFKVLDCDGEWETVRNALILHSFSDDYTDLVIQFFKSHITFGSYSANSQNDRHEEPENDGIPPIEYSRCSVLDVYNKWKVSVDSGIWDTEKQEYYNRIFPSSLSDINSRRRSLTISADFFENYSEDRKTMPESWCTLFMLGTLQSLNYFGESRTESARKNKIENMSDLIKEFSNGETLDNLYDHYLNSHTTDEDDLLEFESLLRVYKFRRQFMDVWSNFHDLKYSKEITKETLVNTSASAEATGRALQTYCSKKSLKYGISLIVRELLDSDFYGTKEEDRIKAFELLNQYTYIPHAYLRRIVFNDWSEYPCEKTSEDIHQMIIETLQCEGLDDDEINAFMKCHDLPFLIFGDKK